MMENLFLSAKNAKKREENLEKSASASARGMGACPCPDEVLFAFLRVLYALQGIRG
jgi:hypothetical protein